MASVGCLFSQLAIEDVVLVVTAKSLPEAAAHWPVRAASASDFPEGLANAYLCGPAADVIKLVADGGAFASQLPLGLLVDDGAPLAPGIAKTGILVEVIPELRAGFSASVWETAVATVCSRHVRTVQDMILTHARRTPNKLAVVFEDREWTFQQVVSMAHSLVVRLRDLGVLPAGGALAVQLPQSDRCAVVYLALYSGRFRFQLLDPTGAGRAYRLEVCPCQALLCETGTEPIPSLRSIFVDQLDLDSSVPVSEVRFEGELEDVAFIEYTSGSTGRPKSVATKQLPLAHWIRWRQFHFPLLEGNDRVAYNLFFIWYWHITLCQGGVTVIYPPRLNHDVSALMRYLDRHKANRCDCLTPGLISALLEVETSLPASFKQVISGGEALPMATCREWLRRWPNVELLNNYALTEAAADISFCRITDRVAAMEPLFAPITDGIIAWNNQLFTVDEELVLCGWNIPDGYLPPTVSTAFTPSDDGRRNKYRTGDRAKWVDGKLFLLGRVDSVVKIRGHRVDLAGLEALAISCAAVKDVVMVPFRDAVWCVVVTEDLEAVQQFAQREIHQADLIVWRRWAELPYTKSGKRDRKQIVRMLEQMGEGVNLETLPGGLPATEEEKRVAAIWTAVLGRVVGRTEPFQQAGGHSLAAMRIAKQLGISPAEVFAYPTVAAMAVRLSQPTGQLLHGPAPVLQKDQADAKAMLAVVGMSVRLPGAPTVNGLWEALEQGRDLISDLHAGPDYVPRKGVVPDLGLDCGFWGLPKEQAALLDTAQRTLLELAYEALEDTGFDPMKMDNHRVGVVLCSGSLPHYATDVLGVNLEEWRTERPDEYFGLEIGVDKDYVATQISFRLNLHGPSEVVQTACSSGLVAVVRAVQMLRLGLCDYVICGGASFSPDTAVRKVDGMIWAPDGVCRPFAEGANGTVHADGAGLVVLSRLEAALERGHRIYATVRGAATNNDGARKAGYSAPSMEGQVEVIQAALADAGLSGHDVDYIEAHGTGTRLGDPLEVQALAKALQTERKVALGSVKGNIGHTNTVAGIPGFIKAALMLFHRRLVPSLHAQQPSSFIDWERIPLRLVQGATQWAGTVAGVSSFGIGGTNAHVLLGAPPVRTEQGPRPPRAWQRDSLAPAIAAIRQQARLASPAARVWAAPTDSGDPGRRGIDALFYETHLVRVDISSMELRDAAVLLDGDVLPAGGLPPGWVIASYERAILAAHACGGNLVFWGASRATPSSDDRSQEELLFRVAGLLQALSRGPREQLHIFFVLDAEGPRYAGLRGLLRSAAREHPELRLRRIFREEAAPLLFPALPMELVLKKDGAYASRLRPSAPGPSLAAPQQRHERALVTGGLRGLGLRVAEWLAESGRAASLVLAGRHPARGEDAERVARLQQRLPTDVHICDVAEWAQVQGLPECDLVVHCAGAVKDGLLLNVSLDDVRQVLRPKVRGAIHLKQRYPNGRLLAFSSSSGVFGVAGQATYAAANTFLDAVMPSVQWGGWGEVGMAVDLGVNPLAGERFMPLQIGLDCLGRALDADEANRKTFCVIDVDWPTFRLNNTVFSPEDPLLADVEAPTPPSSLLGVSCGVGDDSHVRAWDLVLGPAGARWRGASPIWEVCQQHVVSGAPMFPATSFIALALEAAKEATGSSRVMLTDVTFLRPLELLDPRQVTTTLVRNGAGGSLRFTSRPLQEDGTHVLHCTCGFAPSTGYKWDGRKPPTDLPRIEGMYERFAACGFHYGPAFRASEIAGDGTWAHCGLPQLPVSPFALHPATLDAAMHLASVLHELGCRGVPQRIRRLTFCGSTAAASACATCVGGEVALQVLGDACEVVCAVEGLQLAALDAPAPLRTRRRTWRPYTADQRRGQWRACGPDAEELALAGTSTTPEEEHEACFFVVKAQCLEDVRRCREEARRLAAQRPCWCIALQAPLAEAAAAAAAEVGAQAIIGTPEEVRALAGDLGGKAQILRASAGQLLHCCLEAAEEPRQLVASRSEPYVVTIDPSRAARGVQCRLGKRRAPATGEVEIQTSLWALNFRDVLVAVGAISTEVAGQALGIGGECYGEVVAVGPGVHNLGVGDKVIAVPPDGMGSFLTVDARWVAPAPPMTPEEAVSGTCVYATAWLGLKWMARIAHSDRVLIHSAAGGVGLAAVHLCLKEGCVVFATASTPEKRALLLSLGVAAAFDSRDVAAFENGVRGATDGEGVDVVLNSLSGDALPASLRLLKHFGRFIELGKRDQYEDTHLGLAPFLGGLTYAAAHLDVLMLRQPDRCRRLLEEVWADLPQLPRLPTTTFPISQLPQALEYFSKGVHVGKVLVEIDDTPVLGAQPRSVSGPANDPVVQALRRALAADSDPGGIVCIPGIAELGSLEEVSCAQVVLTASAVVAAVVRAVSPSTLCVELPRWEPVASVDEWLSLGGQIVAVEEEHAGDLREWLLEVVEEMAGSIEMDQTFESTGLDSLSLISLARRLSAKVGKAVSVADLYDHPTPQRLLNSFAGRPQPSLLRPKALCLHGFRSNKDAMSLQMAPFVSAVGYVEWVFLNAPRRASGPPDPKIPAHEAYEWWGQPGGAYETGWLASASQYAGLEETLPLVSDLAPAGVVGFSQGAAIAALVESAWVALFSAVMPRGLREREAPSFHCWDPNEDFAGQCSDVSTYFSSKQTHHHHEGHNVPRDAVLVQKFAAFVSAQV